MKRKKFFLQSQKRKKKLETFLYPVKRKYKVQRIDGLKQSMVSPKKETMDKINAIVRKCLMQEAKKVLLRFY